MRTTSLKTEGEDREPEPTGSKHCSCGDTWRICDCPGGWVCISSRENKIPVSPVLGVPHTSVSFTSRNPTRFSRERSKNNPCLLHAGGGESNHYEIYPEHSVLLQKILPSRETILPEPTWLGFYQSSTNSRERECPSPSPLVFLPTNRVKRSWETLVKVSAQGHELTPNHRNTECICLPQTLPL